MIISTANLNAEFAFNLGQQYQSVYGHNIKYASLHEMTMRFGTKELSQIADRSEYSLVTPQIFSALVRNLDLEPLSGIEEPESVMQATFDAADVISFQGKAVDEIIDSSLRQGYNVSLITQANAPQALKEIGCNITRWYLYQDGQLEDDHIVQRRYDEAMKKLEKIVAGEINLDAQFRLTVPFVNMPPSGMKITSQRNAWGR